jgi:hypothetical protein
MHNPSIFILCCIYTVHNSGKRALIISNKTLL